MAAIRELIDEVLRPGHFYLGRDVGLEWEHQPQEEVSWEIFKGRLLAPAQTRKQQVFEAWNVFLMDAGRPSAKPILSLKLDFPAKQLHVVRAVHCYVWEGYDAGGNVFLSRETTQWVRELVGTLVLSSFESSEELCDELICRIFNAVVGASRLALTSVESPLPAFSFGQLGYFYRSELPPSAGPMRGYEQLIAGGLNAKLAWREKIKVLETVLRTVNREELGAAVERFVIRWNQIDPENILALFRGLFDEVSLTPYTDFVDKVLASLDLLVQKGHLTVETRIDFLGYLLRHLGRHLTSYDLVAFHHHGANYPDALLLDAVLKNYLRAIEDEPELFVEKKGDAPLARTRKRIRRRALRQAWLLRRQYEDHAVPDIPTSPGENHRVLPPPYVRVPDEQIVNPATRTKRLFAEDSLDHYFGERSREILRQSLADLRHAGELRELGRALFLDRPLGAFKNPGEPDQTLLFSYEAFSHAVAERRLQFLAKNAASFTSRREFEELRELLDDLTVQGIRVEPEAATPKPGAVAIGDALKVADDFVFLRTTTRSVHDFLNLFSFEGLAQKIDLGYLAPEKSLLLMRGLANRPDEVLLTYDANKQKRLELQVDPRLGFQNRAGMEYPAAGLRILRAWKGDGSPEKLNLAEEERMIPVR